MSTKDTKQVLIRLPVPLLKRIDAAATKQNRSRTAEVVRRLGDSLRHKKTEGANA